MTENKAPDQCPACGGETKPHCTSPSCPSWRRCPKSDCRTVTDANGRSFVRPTS